MNRIRHLNDAKQHFERSLENAFGDVYIYAHSPYFYVQQGSKRKAVQKLHWDSRGATFWAFFKNHDATLLNASILHQLTLKRPSDPKKNRRRNFPKPKTSNFGPILAYVQKKAHLAILKPPSGAMIVPNLWYWA